MYALKRLKKREQYKHFDMKYLRQLCRENELTDTIPRKKKI